jgi:hypothetical protein
MNFMNKVLIALLSIFLLSAACQKIELKTEIPTSPKESYQVLPK